VSLKAKPLLAERKAKKGTKVTFRRAGDASQPLLVRYAVGGTARNGFDYERLPGAIEIPAGRRSAKLVVRPFRDGAFEETETIELEVLPGDGYAAGLLAQAGDRQFWLRSWVQVLRRSTSGTSSSVKSG
jgi:hypothetical protein